MAINYATPIRSKMFLSELERISFQDPSPNFANSCSFGISDGYTLLFSNTYTPDSNGWVTIYDVDKVLESLMTTHFRDFTFIINNESHECVVFKSSVDLDTTGEDFLDNYFLSPMMSPRRTSNGRYEVLYAYCSEETAVNVRLNYFKDGAVRGRSLRFGSISGLGYVDVSPERFAMPPGEILIGYTVACGDRRAEYRIDPNMPAADPSLIYLNCFGVWETIYLTGAKETSGDYTRHSALIDGKVRNYAIDEVIKHNAFTGPLFDGADALAYDLARSKSVFLLDGEGVAGDEVVILDCKTAKSNDPSGMPDFTFEYRRANRRTDKLSSQRPPRIFDDSFDDTFN